MKIDVNLACVNSVKCRLTCTGCDEIDGSKGRPLASDAGAAAAAAAATAGAPAVLGLEKAVRLLIVVPFRTAHPERYRQTQINKEREIT